MNKKALQAELYRELIRRRAKENYLDYVDYVHKGSWKRGRAGVYLCRQVQDFLEEESSEAYEIMILSLPPQHGKSMTITAALPSWFIGRNPQKRVICISYNEEYAAMFGRRNREKLFSCGSELFGVYPGEVNTATEFETSEGGGMISRGVLSGVTGRGCDLLIIDDPVKNRQEADSEVYRRRLFDEWENSFKTRLSAGAKVIVIQTRWHEDDLAGRLLKTETAIKEINLPCECISERGDPLGRKKGESLCPELGKGTRWLKSFKAPYQTQNGSRAWEALFQGRPVAEQGNLIKRSWWRYYGEEELPAFSQLLISVDASFKGEAESNYVAIQVWGKKRADCYLVDALRDKLDFPSTIRAIKRMINKHREHSNISRILIEDKANGSAIIQMLRRELPGVLAVNPQGGKVARLNAVSGAIEAGNVLLPHEAEFLPEFLEECAAFPNGKHDDQVDCMSQALNRLLYSAGDKDSYKDEDFFSAFSMKRKQGFEGLMGGGIRGVF